MKRIWILNTKRQDKELKVTHFWSFSQGSSDLRTRNLQIRKQYPSVRQIILSTNKHLAIIRFLREYLRLFAQVTELGRAIMQKAGTGLAFRNQCGCVWLTRVI